MTLFAEAIARKGNKKGLPKITDFLIQQKTERRSQRKVEQIEAARCKIFCNQKSIKDKKDFPKIPKSPAMNEP